MRWIASCPEHPEAPPAAGPKWSRDLAKIKEVVHEGNVRRITITSEEGKKLIEIPLTVGVVGALLLPVWAAIGAIAAVVTKATIEIERVDE